MTKETDTDETSVEFKTLHNATDVFGFTWDIVFVFECAPPSWADTLCDVGFWVPLSWGGFENAIGFSWLNVESA